MAVEGKVAQAISAYEVAFNVGSEAGVHENDIATAYETTEIHDPDTGELLGVYRRTLMRFRVISVDKKFSVGYSIDTVPNPAYSPMAVISGSGSREQRITKRVTTNRDSPLDRTILYLPPKCKVIFESSPPTSEA
jgi:hypothetical protein